MNIFSGKPVKERQLEDGNSPKTPRKYHEMDSHTSSIYGKLTPMYEGSKRSDNSVNNMKNYYQMPKYA